jgi:hypothetical protein
LRQSERREILIRHFNKECTEFFPPCLPPFSWLRSLFHSCSFHPICFPTSFTSVYPPPTNLPCPKFHSLILFFSFRTFTTPHTNCDLLKCIFSYFIKSLKASEDCNAHTFNTES